MSRKEQKKLNKTGKELDNQRQNLTPEYKPSGLGVATQFGIKRPLREQLSSKNKRNVRKDMTIEQSIQFNDEMTQEYAKRMSAIVGGMLGGENTEWKGKKPKQSKSTVKNRGIPNVKQTKTMGSTVKKILKSPRLLTPAGLMAYIMRPKVLGAGTLRKSGEYKITK